MVLSTLTTTARAFLSLLTLSLRTRLSLQLEILALGHQLAACQRLGAKPRLKPTDRLF